MFSTQGTSIDRPELAPVASGDGPYALAFLNLYRVYRETLSDLERDVLWRVEVERQSYEAAGRETGLDRPAVARTVFEARSKLQQRMTPTESLLRESRNRPVLDGQRVSDPRLSGLREGAEPTRS
ncbi:MAG: sigma-70 family RNA polymerase sigma factor [Planctomycetes bacterium]|nr:sigma-70 family RNA polymerase sigma factor [Planctomycetota bacterium]